MTRTKELLSSDVNGEALQDHRLALFDGLVHGRAQFQRQPLLGHVQQVQARLGRGHVEVLAGLAVELKDLPLAVHQHDAGGKVAQKGLPDGIRKGHRRRPQHGRGPKESALVRPGRIGVSRAIGLAGARRR